MTAALCCAPCVCTCVCKSGCPPPHHSPSTVAAARASHRCLRRRLRAACAGLGGCRGPVLWQCCSSDVRGGRGPGDDAAAGWPPDKLSGGCAAVGRCVAVFFPCECVCVCVCVCVRACTLRVGDCCLLSFFGGGGEDDACMHVVFCDSPNRRLCVRMRVPLPLNTRGVSSCRCALCLHFGSSPCVCD